MPLGVIFEQNTIARFGRPASARQRLTAGHADLHLGFELCRKFPIVEGVQESQRTCLELQWTSTASIVERPVLLHSSDTRGVLIGEVEAANEQKLNRPLEKVENLLLVRVAEP